MKKAKQCLIALLSGVLLAITVLSGCGQSQKAVSKNDDQILLKAIPQTVSMEISC